MDKLELINKNLAACSCEISKNTKGEYSFSVKSYAETTQEAIDKTLTALRDLENKIREGK